MILQPHRSTLFPYTTLFRSNNTYDLAIEGEGFFGIEDGNGGIYLTRDGAFSLDNDGRLVHSSGRYLVMQTNLVADHWSRSEEHTSELQSRPHLVCRLLLEKK